MALYDNSFSAVILSGSGFFVCLVPLRITAENALSYKAVTSRKNRFTWVEIIQGTCTSKRGDGLTDGGYYINYHRVKGHKPGKRYITICIYANTSYCDDIEHRYDIEM